ncbi:MAG: 2-isopropylmalate synthase [Sulfurovaceae bacterium]|nr:2-isopropylmalate synthase [Sulfurovaceae bacterium]
MKYTKFKTIPIENRTWPNNEINKAPIWCSVDLRDGNQSLIKPMSLDKKVKFFKLLVEMGFKEIEIGFPSASEVEFEFTRYLIENHLIPDDVTIQILTQAREHLIARSAEALQGAKNVIVHLYNPTSTMQRQIVYNKSQEEIIHLALMGVGWIKEQFKDFEGMVRLEYSPESFTQTELEFSAKICNAVVEAWYQENIKAKDNEKVILNLPSTVEASSPNIYADQIEWMCRNIRQRDRVEISVHAHNDRGCAVAATELALMAGADRVEGTLLGNGERTGNVDIVTVGLNMYTQGVDPQLDFSEVDKIVKIVEDTNEIKTHVRHPYVGELVYTAFSGSHQDAIKKGMAQQKEDALWYVPYLPIDPKDVGRNYDAIIRINSQSGKGGVAYILNTQYGYQIPKRMEMHIGKVIQEKSDKIEGVMSERMIKEEFEKIFLNRNESISIANIKIDIEDKEVTVEGDFTIGKKTFHQTITSSGIISAISKIFKEHYIDFKVVEYSEHSKTIGEDAKALAYFGLQIEDKVYYGIGEDINISYASMNALVSALNVALNQR